MGDAPKNGGVFLLFVHICVCVFIRCLCLCGTANQKLKLTLSQQSPIHEATIKFEQINIPVSKSLSIFLVVTKAPRISSTGFVPHICVDTQLQAIRVDLKA